jgi:hypothetical protein
MFNNILFSSFCILITFFSVAQTSSTSPYSTTGIGEEGALPDAQFGGYGNISSLTFDSTILNIYNPAGYSILSFGQPLFSIGFSSKFSTYSNALGSFKGNTSGISNFAFGLPIGKRFGAAIGLRPFSRKGYEITTHDYAYDDSLTYSYKGFGTTNLVSAGLSYAILKNERTMLSIGANIGYVFGRVVNERSSTFNAQAPKGGVDFTYFRMKSLYYSFGAYYQQYLDVDRLKQLYISAVFTPQLQMRSYLDYQLYFASNVNDQSTYLDTISFVEDNKGTIRFPSKQTLAVGYSFSPNLSLKTDRLNYQLLVMAEVDLMQWSSYSERFNAHSGPTLSNTFTTRIGAQFVPNIEKNKRSSGAKYFSRIKYRVGAQYGQLPISMNGKQLNNITGTMGFGFPFLSQKTNSSVNLAVQYGSNSTGVSGNLQEKFFSFSVGIVIAPSSYEKWFKKYKLD